MFFFANVVSGLNDGFITIFKYFFLPKTVVAVTMQRQHQRSFKNFFISKLFILYLSSIYVECSDLLDYIQQSGEVLDCEDKCSDSETFVPVPAQSDGNCPASPAAIDLQSPCQLAEMCQLSTQMMDTVDAYGRPMGQQVIFHNTLPWNFSQTITY